LPIYRFTGALLAPMRMAPFAETGIVKARRPVRVRAALRRKDAS